jgi:NAD(P)-dependent dehydrogenase (short-subunit alcohol dehydrogenase family)
MAGKKTVVVGAGQLESELLGNGRAIATLFAREGAEVCVVDMVASRAASTVEEISDDGGHPDTASALGAPGNDDTD